MPDTGGELANIVAHVGADLGKETAKATGEIAKNLLLMLIKNQQEKARVKAGKTNLQRLLKSGEEIKMADLSEQDLHEFDKKAKSYGITYAVISEEGKDGHTVLYKVSEEERVKKVLEDILEKKIKDQVENKSEIKVEKKIIEDKPNQKGLEERKKEVGEIRLKIEKSKEEQRKTKTRTKTKTREKEVR